jgi:septum formation protein
MGAGVGDGSLILASGSPRRAEILSVLGIAHDVRPAAVDEAELEGESAAALAVRLARAKALEVAREVEAGRWILGGDTVVVVDGEMLGKPTDPLDAERMLIRLSGRAHEVVSALALVRSTGDSRAPIVLDGVRVTEVTFRTLGLEEIREYVASGEPMDKAGGYGIQGRGAALVTGVRGDYSGVVGLPVSLLVDLLESAGRPYRFGGG